MGPGRAVEVGAYHARALPLLISYKLSHLRSEVDCSARTRSAAKIQAGCLASNAAHVSLVQGLGRAAEGAVYHERALTLREARLDASDPALAATLINLAVFAPRRSLSRVLCFSLSISLFISLYISLSISLSLSLSNVFRGASAREWNTAPSDARLRPCTKTQRLLHFSVFTDHERCMSCSSIFHKVGNFPRDR